ncbi:small conductance mechanosensitive channel [Roseibium hamelinense]|uniref:Small-conductance mechanosensitive channel n=1 Tax=Roseibium hamelinense TaxID=150831 RepID=A0A562TIH9_9HYPH|nr:mechanosensitive ion channel domain-containing protein [Roseibium hamelinense]MTI42774.1 mechanosensitive ion channel [Roseibium hamelinense]TWI93422.1 small conductance mechanosensitive channel [Roseibium hamelinense]
MDGVVDQVSVYTPLIINAVKALIVLIVGWILAGFLSGLVKRRIVSHPKIDDTIGSFAASIVKWLVLLVTFIAVLNLFGIQATSLVAVLGAGTLAIGLALQGTLSDIAAGVMLIIFRPYKVGQFVDIGGTSGTVQDLNIFVTELVTPDNVQIIMPNGKAWGAIVTNYSAHSTRRLDLTFNIDYADDPDTAINLILDVAKADQRVHPDPEPWVRLVNLGDSSVDLGVRLWCNASDYWELKWHMLKAVKESFDKNGVSIPYPHSVEIQKAG